MTTPETETEKTLRHLRRTGYHELESQIDLLLGNAFLAGVHSADIDELVSQKEEVIRTNGWTIEEYNKERKTK